MAIGVYSYAILSADLPFRFGFWPIVLTPRRGVAAVSGSLLGAPTLRLRGDYLAIVTLGFGEIVQDVLRNVDQSRAARRASIRSTPSFFGYTFVPVPVYRPVLPLPDGADRPFAMILHDRGLAPRPRLRSLREDELAATCMGINNVKIKLMAFAIGAGPPAWGGLRRLSQRRRAGNYDFTVSSRRLHRHRRRHRLDQRRPGRRAVMVGLDRRWC